MVHHLRSRGLAGHFAELVFGASPAHRPAKPAKAPKKRPRQFIAVFLLFCTASTNVGIVFLRRRTTKLMKRHLRSTGLAGRFAELVFGTHPARRLEKPPKSSKKRTRQDIAVLPLFCNVGADVGVVFSMSFRRPTMKMMKAGAWA